MDTSPTRNAHVLWIGVGLLIVTVCLVVAIANVQPGRSAAARPLPVIGPVADFTLTNQLGQQVTLDALRGHVWVADIIFTRCSGPCPRMTRQMTRLQDALPSSDSVRFVTLTTDPDYDTPPVLKKYAAQFGADLARWTFLTGSKKELAALAVGSLKLTAVQKAASDQQDPEDLFVHSTTFVVVDKHARLRGVFQTTGDGVDPARTQQDILAAVARLEREP